MNKPDSDSDGFLDGQEVLAGYSPAGEGKLVASPVVKTFEKYRTPLNISMEMPTLEAIKRIVENKMGVALVPRLTAQAEIERGLLVGLTVKEMRLERKLHLIYRKGATLSHAAKAFLRVAREPATKTPRSAAV
jgi:DNA-binding transcriptional LysR family regulator